MRTPEMCPSCGTTQGTLASLNVTPLGDQVIIKAVSGWLCQVCSHSWLEERVNCPLCMDRQGPGRLCESCLTDLHSRKVPSPTDLMLEHGKPLDFHETLSLLTIQTERYVECMACKKRHDPDDPKKQEHFHTIAGNIYVGLNGGLVGNNFKEDGTLFRTQVVCRAKDCVLAAFDMRGW